MNTPLTRMMDKHAGEMVEKDQEMAELRKKVAIVRGINDMLEMELLGLERRLLDLQKMLDEAFSHVRTLKFNLPEFPREP
jgi:transcriptional regulator of aromatic amino acid metabolism